MVAGHALAQLALLELAARLADRRDGDVLDDHVRRQQRDAGRRGGAPAWMSAIEAPSLWPTRIGSRASSCARSAGRTSSASSWKNAGVRGARGRVRAAVAEAREGDHAAPGRLVQRLREPAPQPDRAEPLVQEHERAAPAVAGQVGDLDRQSVDHGHGRERSWRVPVRSATECATCEHARVIGDVLWTPPADVRETTEIGRYLDWLRDERGRDLADYDELWRWSVDDLEGFWGSIWDFFGVRAHAPYERVLGARAMPGAEWFPGARLNYAEHVLGTDEDARPRGGRRPLADARPDRADLRRAARAGRAGARRPAAPRRRARRPRRRLPAQHPRDARRVPRHREPRRGLGELRAGVRRAQRDRPLRADRAQGAARGRRLHATATGRSTAATRWPTIRAGLPTLEHVVARPLRRRTSVPDAVALGRPARRGRRRSRSSPSPSTTRCTSSSRRAPPGCPRRSSTATAAMLVEHLKGVGLGWDLKPGGRLLWFSTTAWMMWNALVSALLVRASIVMIDGDPMWPDPSFQWRLAEETRPTFMGVSPDVPHGLPQGGPRARPRVRPLEHPRPRLRRLAAAAARATTTSTSSSAPTSCCSTAAAAPTSAAAFVSGSFLQPVYDGRDLRPLPRRRRPGLRRRRPRGRRRARRARRSREPMPSMPVGFWDDAGRRALPLGLLRPVPRRLAPGRLDPLHRARQLRHHRPLGRDAQPRRRAHRHERALRRRRGVPGGRRQPRRAPRGRRGRRRAS